MYDNYIAADNHLKRLKQKALSLEFPQSKPTSTVEIYCNKTKSLKSYEVNDQFANSVISDFKSEHCKYFEDVVDFAGVAEEITEKIQIYSFININFINMKI